MVHGDKVLMQPVNFWTAVDSSQNLERNDSGKRQSIQGRYRVTDKAYAASDTIAREKKVDKEREIAHLVDLHSGQA